MNPHTAAERLKAGDLVVFPTETVYGIGALASNDKAVNHIFKVKGRPQHNPLILHIAHKEQLSELVTEVPKSAQKLIETFWPGPLTICFRKSDKVSEVVTAGLPTVCVRNPDHPIAHDILKEVGEAVAAPSANLSGKPSTTRYEDAKRQLENKGVFFIEGGETTIGLESTVVDCTKEQVRILRPGSVSKVQLEECLKDDVLIEDINDQVASPGQLLEHYAPQAELTVIMGSRAARRAWLHNKDLTDVTLGIVGNQGSLHADELYCLGNEGDMKTFANHLYEFLNTCDEVGSKKIYLEFPYLPKDHFFPALLNRLEKASRGNILNVDQS